MNFGVRLVRSLITLFSVGVPMVAVGIIYSVPVGYVLLAILATGFIRLGLWDIEDAIRDKRGTP